MVSIQREEEWEHELKKNPKEFISTFKKPGAAIPAAKGAEVLIIEGSPRAEGNCSIIAGWASEEVEKLGRTTQVMYLDDLSIRACIGCYQCYNTGTCTFDDDMSQLINALHGASYLIICSPVYTSTVPGGLKVFIDRCLAYHASRVLGGAMPVKKGILFSIAGRTGIKNFVCVTRVIYDFMRNLGILPAGEVLIDGVDRQKDIRKIEGVEKRVRKCVKEVIGKDS